MLRIERAIRSKRPSLSLAMERVVARSADRERPVFAFRICITYIRAVKQKWYVEFLIIVVMIVMAIIFALNIDFSSSSKTSGVNSTENVKPKTVSPEKERWLEGRSIFRSHCASCHNIKYDGVGPPLKGVADRWKKAGSYQGKTGGQWMKIWIRNWHDVVDAKYKYGIDMANSRPAQMNIFVELTDKQIDDILFYTESPDMAHP